MLLYAYILIEFFSEIRNCTTNFNRHMSKTEYLIMGENGADLIVDNKKIKTYTILKYLGVIFSVMIVMGH
jgi:hypothetical protein